MNSCHADALTRRVGILVGAAGILLSVAAAALIAAAALFPPAAFPADTTAALAAARIDARSATLAAVGIVHGDRMTLHVSRVLDNAPLRDAVVTVLLRGVTHPATAEADGSYTMQSKDLTLPGPAAVIFRIVQGDTQEDLKGSLQVADDTAKPDDKNSSRQLGWWVLNFAVCIGFLMLLSRRRKAAAQD